MHSRPEYDRVAIERYLSGKMKPEEAHAMERAASEDAFLAAAIDGLAALPPEAVDAVKVADVSRTNRRLWWVVPVAIGAIAYGVMWFSQKDSPQPEEHTANVTVAQEAELSEEIDSWDANQSADVIKSTQTDSSVSFTVRVPVTKCTEQPLKAESVSPRLETFVLFEIQVVDELREEEPDLFPEEKPEDNKPVSYDHLMYEIARFQVYSYKGKRDRKFDLLSIDPGGLSAAFSNPEEQSDQRPSPPRQMVYDDFLERAIMHFAEGRYKVAEWHFQDILNAYDDDINATFYSGMGHWHEQKWEKAIARFEAVAHHEIPVFREPARFYLAKTHRAMGDVDTSKALLQEIADAGGFYAQQAKSMLE